MLREYTEQLPCLKAQESLAQITAIALGTGSMKKESSAQISWELANKAREKTLRIPLDPEQQKFMLASMGIGLEWQRN